MRRPTRKVPRLAIGVAWVSFCYIIMIAGFFVLNLPSPRQTTFTNSRPAEGTLERERAQRMFGTFMAGLLAMGAGSLVIMFVYRPRADSAGHSTTQKERQPCPSEEVSGKHEVLPKHLDEQ